MRDGEYEEPALPEAGFQFHSFGIVESVTGGTLDFVSDDYLNAISAETTITATEFCAAGAWRRTEGSARGLGEGQVVEREPYDLLFGERKAADSSQLGRPPGGEQEAARIFLQLMAAEPRATGERRRELQIGVAAWARRSPFASRSDDLVLQLDLDLSRLARENARLARLHAKIPDDKPARHESPDPPGRPARPWPGRLTGPSRR